MYGQNNTISHLRWYIAVGISVTCAMPVILLEGHIHVCRCIVLFRIRAVKVPITIIYRDSPSDHGTNSGTLSSSPAQERGNEAKKTAA